MGSKGEEGERITDLPTSAATLRFQLRDSVLISNTQPMGFPRIAVLDRIDFCLRARPRLV
jgi:hypothetical protein